eukprot:CAMPEP_0183308474 /NCGR_PEP_ID=MMETSP0160_2-20130417/22202_1 /TAXON_ID=2839 ORGANISM="Odontella Sinensis, Strain Grunow 1884" /NCGR_SAMPLE_ID=MMETSP0160_2 /ASSEMBLY_ACC=CAM_ASM_000250 /LENGTH=356 /DNA_ID=CAMNT_0025472323 /DNA_START=63 /DNA_END=1133 /DNA_ORIENTATION=+
MSLSLVPVGPVRDDSEGPFHHPLRWLDDDVDRHNAQNRTDNFATSYVPALDETADTDGTDLEEAETDANFRSNEGITEIRIRHIGKGRHKKKTWKISNAKLLQHSDYFRQIMVRRNVPIDCGRLEETTPDFREILEGKVEFDYDAGLNHALGWIAQDGKKPIQDVILSHLEALGEQQKEKAGDEMILTLRAAHYLGCPRMFSQLERFLAGNAVDTHNCMSLLGLADELGARVLARACTEQAVRNICEVEEQISQDRGGGDTIPEGMKQRFRSICSLRAATVRFGIPMTDLPDWKEYLGMLRELLAGQEERFIESEALAKNDGSVRALEILEKQRSQIKLLREYIRAQEDVLHAVLG